MIWTCQNCGLRLADVDPFVVITCKCGHVDRRKEHSQPGLVDGVRVPPNVLRRGINFAKAYVKWVLAGRPVRSPEEISWIRSHKCAPCDLFNGQVCTHQKCGCKVTEPGAFGDKIKMATEHCPIGEW